jgi:hypothetical protein
MDVKLNRIEKPGAEPHIAGAINTRINAAVSEGLTSAMAVVWEERSRYPVLSETFFALTKVWETLCAQRGREETKGKS